MPVFKAITGDWEKITDSDIDRPLVPAARACLIREKFNAVDQLREAAHYYALYSYGASWKHLCVCLYTARETAALQIARSHLQTVRGTCTCAMSCMWTEDMYMYIILFDVHVYTCSFIHVPVIIFILTSQYVCM